MKIKNPKTGKYLNIYSARLTFVQEKDRHVRDTVRVTIYYHGKKEPKKIDLPIPKDIDVGGLNWIKEKGIAVYYREDHKYRSGEVSISTGLGQKLENIVLDACFGNSEQK
jgi:hypothetical protein